MIINHLTIEVCRDGPTPKLVVQGRPIGLETPITLDELEQLAAHLTQVARDWRRARLRISADYYTLLGVDRGASAEEIQQGYRGRAKQEHPDTSAGDTTGAMQALNEAYAVLGDPLKRQQYDSTR